jgi:hypothetical protein
MRRRRAVRLHGAREKSGRRRGTRVRDVSARRRSLADEQHSSYGMRNLPDAAVDPLLWGL